MSVTLPATRSTLRMREKYVLFLILATFIVFCMGGFFFLPELKAGTQFAYRQIKDAGPDLLGLIPPVDQGPTPSSAIEAPIVARYPVRATARAKMEDMQRLASKIQEEWHLINRSQQFAVLPPPIAAAARPDMVPGEHNGEGSDSGSHESWSPPRLPSGEPNDPETKHRRDTVRGMMEHAWTNYVQYAWGENELRPISKRGHSPGIFGNSKLGEFDWRLFVWFVAVANDVTTRRQCHTQVRFVA